MSTSPLHDPNNVAVTGSWADARSNAGFANLFAATSTAACISQACVTAQTQIVERTSDQLAALPNQALAGGGLGKRVATVPFRVSDSDNKVGVTTMCAIASSTATCPGWCRCIHRRGAIHHDIDHDPSSMICPRASDFVVSAGGRQ